MKRNLLLSISLLVLPCLASATGKIEYNIINASPSLAYPIVEVQQGYVEYFYMPTYGGTPVPEGCPTQDHPAHVKLSDLTSLPFSVSKVKNSTITFTPADLSLCMQTGTQIQAYARLQITQANDMHDSNCGVDGRMQSPYVGEKSQMEILRTADSFYCH